MQKPFKIAIYGAGAIGTTLAAWMTDAGHEVALLARGESAQRLKRQGIRILNGEKVMLENTRVKVIEDLSSVDDIDLLIITVKNFDLDACCQAIVNTISSNTLILGLQNGIENQTILPKYFSRVIYAIVNYNAWHTAATAEQNTRSLDWNVNLNGPIILGTPDNTLQPEAQKLRALFSSFLSYQHSLQFQDHAHAKLVSNLANSVTTITGNSHREVSALTSLQTVLTQISYEGIKTLQAAGFRETSTGPLPAWRTIKLSRLLPAALTRPIFRRKLALIGSTSMASDIISKGTGNSELESINGYMLKLANRHNVHVPYSRRLYHLCKQRFSETPFQPMAAWELRDYLL
ncbi:MAG: hypothetical protein COA99_05985 [Moraxellaceae bacterium]|nr:MAG: hypothetical protein COA99_05985 [Moraxellaceae bacterium]